MLRSLHKLLPNTHLFAFISNLFSEIGKDFHFDLIGPYFFHLILSIKIILTAQLNDTQKEVCSRLYTPEQTENNFSKNSLVLDKQILTLRLLMSYIYGAPILDVSRSYTTTHHSR